LEKPAPVAGFFMGRAAIKAGISAIEVAIKLN
jgi:hypothetical protein